MGNLITFQKLSRFDRIDEPCSLAVPFPAGHLRDPARFAILDDDRPIPVQTSAAARWPDGSVKWLHADFLACLPGNRGKAFTWQLDATQPVVPESPVRISRETDIILLETGSATLRLGAREGMAPFAGITMEGGEGVNSTIDGPSVTDDDGNVWTAAVSDQDWRDLRSGPVHAILEATGKHKSPDGESMLDFVLRIHAFAGKPWFQVDYRVVNREASSHLTIQGILLRVRPGHPDAAVRTSLGISNYLTRVRRGAADEALSHCIDAEQLVYGSNEQIPEVNYGTFWADWYAETRGGICVTIHQAQQNFPKAFEVDADGIRAWLYPDSTPPLCLRQGVARTQRLLLHPHLEAPDAAEISTRSLQFQMPDRPALPPETYEAAGVFEPVWIRDRDRTESPATAATPGIAPTRGQQRSGNWLGSARPRSPVS